MLTSFGVLRTGSTLGEREKVEYKDDNKQHQL